MFIKYANICSESNYINIYKQKKKTTSQLNGWKLNSVKNKWKPCVQSASFRINE